MDIIGVLATDLNLIGKLIYNVLFNWVSGWSGDIKLLGSFSITVIIFTLFLKLATSPFDVWQKVIQRKNTKIMEIMKPELDKITKQCGSNRELLMQKQRAVHKKYNYSALASCLPMVITLAIFFIVFSGFNSAVRYHNSKTFDDMSEAYNIAFEQKTQDLVNEGKILFNEEEDKYLPAEGYTVEELKIQQVSAAEQAVLDAYEFQGFLLTKNVFMPDTWKSPIPTADVFSNTGIGKLGIKGIDGNEYEKVMKPLIEKYNTNEEGKNVWNGYLMLPILAFLLNLAAAKLNKPPEQPPMAGQTEEQIKAQQAQGKMMQFMMPIMMFVFALLYSTAFTLYMFVNSLVTTIFNLTYNIIAKNKDKKETEHRLATTIKKK